MSKGKKKGILVKSLERLVSPRTLVAKKRGGELVSQRRGQKRANFYIDIDSDFWLKSKTRSKDGVELKTKAHYNVEIENSGKLVEELPSNEVSQGYIENLFSRKYNHVVDSYCHDSSIEEILENKDEFEATVNNKMEHYMREKGFNIVDWDIDLITGRKRIGKDNFKKIKNALKKTNENVKKVGRKVVETEGKVEGIPTEDEIESVVENYFESIESKGSENYEMLSEEISQVKEDVKCELKEEYGNLPGEIEDIVDDKISNLNYESSLEDISSKVDRLAKEVKDEDYGNKEEFELLKDEIYALKSRIAELNGEAPRKEYSELKEIAKELEDFKEVKSEMKEAAGNLEEAAEYDALRVIASGNHFSGEGFEEYLEDFKRSLKLTRLSKTMGGDEDEHSPDRS